MARLAFLHTLDALTSRGCDNPLCHHDHSTGLFLVPLCHAGVGVRLDLHAAPPGLSYAAVAHLRCRRCRASVIEVALATPFELTPTCRHGRALDVCYHEGCLTVSCRRCAAGQGSVDVAAYRPA
jgi:hypothetical protein